MELTANSSIRRVLGHTGGYLRPFRRRISRRRGHQQPQGRVISIERVFIQIAVNGKRRLDTVHSLLLREIELLLSTEIVHQQLQIDSRSDNIFGYVPKTRKLTCAVSS